MYGVDGDLLARQYKQHISGFEDWELRDTAEEYVLFPENIGTHLSIDETCLSHDELYTIVTNKAFKGKKGSLVAMVKGTKAEVVIDVLRRIYEKSAPSRDAQKIYIVCEGKEREKEYFEFFQGISTNLQLIIIPPEGGKTDPVKLMEQAIKVFLSDCPEHRLDESEKDLVWFAIDTDTWME